LSHACGDPHAFQLNLRITTDQPAVIEPSAHIEAPHDTAYVVPV
jgi:hypothetical protein